MAITSDGTPTYFNLTQDQYNEALSTVIAAQAAWSKLITEFAAENIAMGIIQAQKVTLIGQALQLVNMYASQGALAQAYQQLAQVVPTPTMAPFITQQRLDYLKNRIVAILSGL